MTDHPADTPRLTDGLDANLYEVANPADQPCHGCGGEFDRNWTPEGAGAGVDHKLDCPVLEAVAEIRRHRALLADLKAEGCPTMSLGDESGDICHYCGADAKFVSGESWPQIDHRPMEDGQPCLWLRIERA